MWRGVLQVATKASALAIAATTIAVAAAVAVAVAPAGAASERPGDVNEFVIESFDATYTLGRDDAGRSTLHTVERIDIRFPEFDQNRGFIRDLVRVYDGHPTELEVLGVTDADGAARAYELDAEGDVLLVTIAVPEGSFVHGLQSYLIEYTQRDVTLHPSDADVDEFTWDVNGTDWMQPSERVSARVELDEALASALTGAAACYRGQFGAETPCEIARVGTTWAVDETALGPGENVTLSIGFASGTFTEHPTPLLERIPLLLYGGFASLGGAILALVAVIVRSRRGPSTGRAIIAQYEPPEGMNVAVAAELVRARPQAMTALLLDLAVRRRIRLLHDDAGDLYGAMPLDSAGLDPTEAASYGLLFSGVDDHGSVWFTRDSTRLGDARAALVTRAGKEVREARLMRRTPTWVLTLVAVLFILALLLPVVHAVIVGNFVLMTILLAVGVNALVWLLLFIIGGLGALRRRTHEGALLHDHLMGLREYIRLAEADRIRMLQSASGAEVDEQRIVQVYEKLLPYAVLFGFEKEWQGELARHYNESPPDWVSGPSHFSTGFPLRSFDATVSIARVTRSSSSSSGSRSSFSSSRSSSSGGGFSGGGGGGGGGRGI